VNAWQGTVRNTVMASLVVAMMLPLVASGQEQARKEDDITATTLAQVDAKLLAYNTAEARKLIEPLAAMANRDAFVALALGRVREQEGEYTDAINYLKKAAELAPSDAAAFLSLGEVYVRTKHDWDAAVAFKRAFDLAQAQVEKQPKNANAYYLLGIVEQRLQHYDQSAKTFDKALSLDPGNTMARYQLGVTKTFQGSWQGAVDNLTKAIDKDSGIAYAYYYRGIAAGRIGKKDLMVNDMERFLKMAPKAPEAEKAKAVLTAAKR
jgi:tetratricopeptide (TPR) repeat protein